MPKIDVQVESNIRVTPRMLQLGGIFDVQPTGHTTLRWQADLPIEEREWNVGLIVGPSGCGKSTVARHLWAEEMARSAQLDWPTDKCVLDGFPQGMSIKDIVELLSGVGFSAPPNWLRPFRVLSQGEQFRVTMARVLAEMPQLAVVDEFTSVVDRTVAQIGSSAIAKAVRRRNQKFVAVSCHSDIIDWLDPDWIFRPDERKFGWRLLQGRPTIDLQVCRVHHSAWSRFHQYHYLTSTINKSAVCFCAFWKGRPVAFDAWLSFFGKLKDDRKARRGHRTVCLPDYQGVGIGNALFTFAASLWKGLGYRAFSATGHPAEIAHRKRSELWRMTRGPGFTARDTGRHARWMAKSRASSRLTASFEYVGPALERERAKACLENWAYLR